MNTAVRPLFIPSLAVLLLLPGCYFHTSPMIAGSGIAKSETRSLPPFHAIKIIGSIDTDIVCQKSPGAVVTADDNLLPLITTEVSSGTLIVSSHGNYNAKTPLHIMVNAKDIDHMESNGSSDVHVNGLKNSDTDIAITGSGDVIAAGSTKTLNIAVSGSGDVDAHQLPAVDTTVSISGSGDITVKTTKSLQGDISGSGDVVYYGHPTNINVSTYGSGTAQAR